MKKTEKVMELTIKETTYVVTKDNTAKRNPYKIHILWWDYGWHRKKVTEYENLESVLLTLTSACRTRDGWISFDKDGVTLTH